METTVSSRKSVSFYCYAVAENWDKNERFMVYGFSLTSWNFLQDNRYDLSDLRIAVKVRSAELDSQKFP